MNSQVQLEELAAEILGIKPRNLTELPLEKRAAYYESIVINCIQVLISHGHNSDYLSHRLATELNCVERLPDHNDEGFSQ